ncbi:MAG: hypothetical protein U0350_06375 [Caldilineaceae bacterium]
MDKLFGRRSVWLLGSIGIALLLSTSIVMAAPLTQDAIANDTSSTWSVLAPLLIAIIGVERAIEIIWNYLEWLLLGVGKWQAAQLKSASYLQFKSGTSLVVGVILGILLANYTGMHLFDALKPLNPIFLAGMPAAWDVLITGFLIGAGAKPIHDLLGVITQLKNFLSSSAMHQREAAGAALAEGILKLAQSEAQAMVDVPGIGPTRLPSGPGNLQGLGAEEATNGDKSPTEKYIELLHGRTAQ